MNSEDVRLPLEAKAWGEQYHAGMSQKEAAAFKRGHAAGWRDALEASAVSSPSDLIDALDEMNAGGRIQYGDYSRLHDLAAMSSPPTITDDMAERAELERDSHKYTLVIGSNPPRALCTCGWEGLYAGEWRKHREKAALTAALHPGGEG